MDALEPYITKTTMEYHFGKHHKGYYNKLKAQLETDEYAEYDHKELEYIVKNSHETGKTPIFNNAAQLWNHNFYWNSLTPNLGDTVITNLPLGRKIDSQYGSYAEFQTQFTELAASNFGSGWTWLVQKEDGDLLIINTDDAGTPLTNTVGGSLRCLLVVDVWEHADGIRSDATDMRSSA